MRVLRFILIVVFVVSSGTDVWAVNRSKVQSEFPKTEGKMKAGKPARIVCFGDSVTGVYYHTGSRRAYTDMLGIALKKAVPSANIEMINAGISGHTTVNALARIDRDVLKHRPDLVTVMFGLNDMTRVPLKQYQENLESIIEKCRGVGAEVMLCTPNAVISTQSRPAEKLIKYCEVVRSVGKAMKVPVCDCYQKMSELRDQDALAWRLMMSDEIHPNMAGHKKIAELIAETATAKTVSLADVRPPVPAIPRTLSRLKKNQPVRIIAMPPLDQLVERSFKKIAPNAQLKMTVWKTDDKTRKQIESDAKALVRSQKPDLVLIMIPRTAKFKSRESFIHSYIWTMNYSLNFGKGGWDCVIFHPAVFDSQQSDSEYDTLTRQLVLGQDLTLVDRKSDQEQNAEKIVMHWLQSQLD